MAKARFCVVAQPVHRDGFCGGSKDKLTGPTPRENLMHAIRTRLPGTVIIEPNVFSDSRGFFMETYHHERYADLGLSDDFVQDNLSFSMRRTLRGLHYQNPHPQGKLVYVVQGEVFDVAVDIRFDSPTFGQWVGVVLSAENHRQFYLPPGFAHGFCVTSETALLAYKCTNPYVPEADGNILWNDPAIGIEWPVADPLLSEKDRWAPRLKDIPSERLSFGQPQPVLP